MSLVYDPTRVQGFKSLSHASGVMMETWAEMNLYCLGCPSDRLLKLPVNTPVSDFVCTQCGRLYQLKAKNGRFRNVVPGSEYNTMLAAVRANRAPEFILAEYDIRWSMVVWLRALPGAQLVEERIVPRKPLSASARRAGWQGCNLNIDGLRSVSIVAPIAADRVACRADWKRLDTRP